MLPACAAVHLELKTNPEPFARGASDVAARERRPPVSIVTRDGSRAAHPQGDSL
jgi:hypothetical protein